MSANTIIRPETHSPRGKIPRNLLITFLVVFFVVAAVLFLSGSPPDADPHAEMQKKLQIQAANAEKGDPRSVEAAAREAEAEHSREVEQARRSAAAASASEAANASIRVPAPLSQTAGVHAQQSSGRRTSADDGANVELDLADRQAPSVVFDGTQRAPEGPAQSATRRRGDLVSDDEVGSTEGGAGAPSGQQLAELLRMQMTPPGMESRQMQQAKWQNQLGASKSVPAIFGSPAPGPYVLRIGEVIPSITTRDITTDTEGVVTARSRVDVYDSNRNLLIPKGSVFRGKANTRVAVGDARIQAAFTTLRLPDGFTFVLPAADASDSSGMGGLSGDVDRHFFRSFGSALLLGVLADRTTQSSKLPNTQISTSGNAGISATGQVFVDTARVELERAKGIAPTITVKAGTPFNIEVVADMVFPGPYRSKQ